MGTGTTPGFQKFELSGNEYTSTVVVPSLTPTSTAKVYRTNDHGYVGINFKIQGRNDPSGAWTDIDTADENDDVLAFGEYLYQRVWVKPTGKATTSVSSSNVVTVHVTDLTDDVTTSFTGVDPYQIDETTNTYVFQEPIKIGTIPFTVHIGEETYTNAATATTEGTAYDYVTLAFANPTLSLTTSNVTISSAKLYKDDVLFHTYATESNVVLRSDQTGTYQAVVNDVYYSNRVTPDFTTTRSVSAPQLNFDGYNKLSLSNIIPTSTSLQLGANTYAIGTASNIYILNSGTYTATVSNASIVAYLSNVVGAVSQHPTDLVPALTFDGFNKLTIDNAPFSLNEWPPTDGVVTIGSLGQTSTWSISGASYGNGTYIATSSVVPFNLPTWTTYNAFDKITNATDAWHTNGSTTGIITIQFPISFVLETYNIYHRANQAGGDSNTTPKNWTIDGSNDGTIWTVIDTRTDQVESTIGDATSGYIRSYTVSNNSIAYTYYRINITANNGNTSYLILGEWKLFEKQNSIVFQKVLSHF